ncbi:Fic family protein [Desulfobacula sp.]|uniref:Fic family protein n=1 Tax=Desulfobacula sp. TaxID=2593537 RepID=UPI0025C3E113|nr:Fic family protein [Desulfobacula sp.]MBC2704879.1 Fic family protein [Desulfobacula sp.]
MKTFEKTHNWINFRLDLRKASYKLWVQLGEAQSKCRHISGVPLMPSVAGELYKVFLAKGALATTAIEGNTLTEEEVKKHLDGELKLPPSKEYLKNEVNNIIEACNTIGKTIISTGNTKLTLDKIKQYNAWVLNDLPLDEDVEPGIIRKHSVGVGTYIGAPAEDCEYLLKRLCEWINKDFNPSGDEVIIYGILKAIICHIYIAWIHPFGDGNGRTARLLEFEMLLSSGVPAPSAQLLSNHYNQTRTEYYRQLDATHKSGGDIFKFIMYALQGFIDGLFEQLDLIQEQQLHVHWLDYIHDVFSDKDSAPEVRRRRFAVDLSNLVDPVPVAKARHISPRIAEAYASLTEKTVTRDINALIKLGVVIKTPQGIVANKGLMHAFLPPKVS